MFIDAQAEKAVLSCLVRWPLEVFPLCYAAGVGADAFALAQNRATWETLESLHREGMQPDFVCLVNRLEKDGRVVHTADVSELFYFIPSAPVAPHYIAIVVERHMTRRAMLLAEKMTADLAESNCDPEDILNAYQGQMLKLVTRQNSTRKTTKQLIREICEEVIYGKPDAGRLLTLIEPIDAELLLYRTDYLVIPGPTSSGKSALCAQLAIAYAKQGHRVLYVPLEMSARQVLKRAIASESGQSAENVRAMVMNNRDMRGISRDDSEVGKATKAFADAAGALTRLDLTVRDDIQDLDAILSTARSHAAEKPLDVLCVDYPALMAMRGNFERRQLALAHASQSFKRFASEMNGLVITPSQVNKDGGTREAADFENDANAILAVRFSEKDETQRVVTIAKQRDGERGQTLRLAWHGATTSFKPATQQNP